MSDSKNIPWYPEPPTIADAIPSMSLLETDIFPVEGLAHLAKREGQRSKSIYRAHRWFARRRGSQFRGILIGLHLNDNQINEFWDSYGSDDQYYNEQVILDPFLGGGTSLVEASRFGARVIGTDIDPVPSTISRFQLEASTIPDLDKSLRELKDAIGTNIQQYHWTRDEEGEKREVLYHFWVQVTNCYNCDAEVEIHPHYQLAYDKSESRQWAFCRHCHGVQELDLDRQVLVCGPCNRRTHIEAGSLRNGTILCPECRAEETLAENSKRRKGPPLWRLFAQQFLIRHGPGPRQVDRIYKKATTHDREVFNTAAEQLSLNRETGNAHLPTRKIPVEGRSDSRPLLHGFEYYHELFNERQLLHLSELTRELNSRRESPRRRALALAFSEHLTTNNMLVGYAFGYERTSPLFSIQSYRHITRPVEVNPWLHKIGRGTYPNAVSKISKAIQAASTPTDILPNGEKRISEVAVGSGRPVSTDLGDASDSCVVTARSSENLNEIPDDFVDLVITDPPYGDNISYSELSDFYLAWHQILGIAPGGYSDTTVTAPLQENLATNGRTHSSLQSFKNGLTAIFSEINRVLKPQGRLVFTFRHADHRPWEALANSLYRGDFSVAHSLPLRGEGSGGLKSHPGTVKWDAVLTCRMRKTSNKSEHLDLSNDALDRVQARIDKWVTRLSDDELEFENQDALNLCRSFLVEEAIRDPGQNPLGNTLKNAAEEFHLY